MSASIRFRVPPVAPRQLDDGHEVEDLVLAALGRPAHDDLISHDGGLTGGVLLKAGSRPALFLEGALEALPVGSEERLDLAALLQVLAQHGGVLVTKEY